jgi:hypothetical protein
MGKVGTDGSGIGKITEKIASDAHFSSLTGNYKL